MCPTLWLLTICDSQVQRLRAQALRSYCLDLNTALYYLGIVCLVSHVRLFVTLWTVAHQAPLVMGLSRQEHWSGLPFPSTERRRNCVLFGKLPYFSIPQFSQL